jgi:AcrR family transcriptional regulator
MIRERILEAAFFEFSEKGFYNTNVHSITRKVPISRAVFSEIVADSSGLVRALVQGILMDDQQEDSHPGELWKT